MTGQSIALTGPAGAGSPASGRARAAAPTTTHAKAATRATPRAPAGRDSPKRADPAAIGRAFVHNVAIPAVVAFNHFTGKVENFHVEMNRASSQLVNRLFKVPELRVSEDGSEVAHAAR